MFVSCLNPLHGSREKCHSFSWPLRSCMSCRLTSPPPPPLPLWGLAGLLCVQDPATPHLQVFSCSALCVHCYSTQAVPWLGSSSHSWGQQYLIPDQMPPAHALLWSSLYSMCYKFHFTSHCPSSCLVLGDPQPNSTLCETRKLVYSSLNPECLSSAWHCFTPEMSVEGKESGEKGWGGRG